jgi:PAS domain S-box-containing protein
MNPIDLTKTKTKKLQRFEKLWNITTLVIVIFAVIFSFVFSDSSINKIGIYYLAFATALVCLIYHFLILKGQKNQSRIYFKSIADVIIIACLIHFTGCFGNYFFFLHFLPILASALYLPILGTEILAGLACLFTLLENIYSPDQIIFLNFQMPLTVFLIGGIILMAIFARFLTYEITKEQKEIEKITDWASKIAQNRSPLDSLLYALGKIPPPSLKQKKAEQVVYAFKFGKVVEVLAWLLGLTCIFLSIFTSFPLTKNYPFKLIGIIALGQAFFYHGLAFKKIAYKNPKLAIQIDSFIILILLFLFTEIGGGIATPLALVFACAILGGSLLFGPYSSFLILGLELAIIIPFAYFQPLQREFIISNPYLAFSESILFFLVAIFSYFFSKKYFESLIEKEKEEELINQLVTNKTRAEATFQSIQDGLFVVDMQKKIILVNNVAKKMLGWGKGKILDQFYGDVFKLKRKDKFLFYETDCPIQKAISENRVVIQDDLDLITDNKQIPIIFYAAPITDQQGNIIGGIAVLRDIAREKEMDELKNEFISIASHEINTPLAAIEGYLSMIVDEGIGKLDEKALGFVNQAFLGSRHLANLIRDLRNVSKIYQGKLRISSEPISIEKIIEQVIRDFAVSMKKLKVKLQYISSSKPLPKVLADPNLIQEVITNLVSNAIKFTIQGSITVSAYKQKNKMIVTVSDTGIGIPEKDLPYIFERFYRAKTKVEEREISGTGLGLYIVKSILKLHKSKIQVESKEGQGSKFSFSLPLAPQIKKQK